MVTERFIYVHIPKTGGLFIARMIKEKYGIRILPTSSHLSLEKQIRSAKLRNFTNDDLPSFCFIRNPWDWYVSRFCYRYRARKKVVFDPVVIDAKSFQCHMELIANTDKSELRQRYGRSAPVYKFATLSEHYNYMVGSGVDYVGRFENFGEDLGKILCKIVPHMFNLQNIVDYAKKPINISKHLHYSKYYTSELIEQVAQWDKNYIAKFNYVYSDQPYEIVEKPKVKPKRRTKEEKLVDIFTTLLVDTNRELNTCMRALTELNKQALKKLNRVNK